MYPLRPLLLTNVLSSPPCPHFRVSQYIRLACMFPHCHFSPFVMLSSLFPNFHVFQPIRLACMFPQCQFFPFVRLSLASVVFPLVRLGLVRLG